MSEMTAAQIKSKRMLFLACSTIALLFLGLIYAFSMFATPMCKTFGLEKSAVGLTFNIMMISFCFGAVASSQIEKKLGIKSTIIIAAALTFIGFAGTGLFANGNITVIYLFYGVLGGAGVGIGYNSIVATTNVWFPDKVGFSSGVLMMGFSFGSLILGTLAMSLIQPLGMALVLIIIGIASAAVTCLPGMILSRPPSNIVEVIVPEKAVGNVSDPADDEKLLKTPTFYVYWIWAIIVVAIGLATIGNCLLYTSDAADD